MTLTEKRKLIIDSFTLNAKEIITEEYLNSLIITYEKGNYFYYLAFIGRKVYPSFKTGSATSDLRDQNVSATKTMIKNDYERKKKYFDSAKEKANSLQVGSIMFSDWGYEQTNINFFLIIERKNSILTLQEIGKNKKFDAQDSGTCTPNKETKIGEPFKRRISKHATVIINDCYDASIYNGEELYWSSYY